jgi:hypothetical protein
VVELWDKISAETKRMADKMADKMVVRANKKPVFWVLIGLFMAFILALQPVQ